MKMITALRRLLTTMLRWPLLWLVRLNRLPENPIETLGLDPSKPILFVLGAPSTTNLALLRQQCTQIGLPSPLSPLCKEWDEPSYLYLKGRGFFSRAKQRRHRERLQHLVAFKQEHPETKIQVVPVSLYWGRAPDNENSLTRLLFRDVEAGSRLRKFFTVIFQRSHTFIHFSKQVELDAIIRQERSLEQNTRTLARVLRVHFHRRRIAALGRTVSQRRTLVNAVVTSDGVQRAIRRESEKRRTRYTTTHRLARKYALEIAANYSYFTVRFLDRILGRLWHRIYDGIEVYNSESVRQLAEEAEIIYVPCHRSHMDYLLLGYTLYRQGLVPPHIAAGINLNFWPVGSILRHGGAFFIRRTFRGNKLYSAVFNEYLHTLFSRGVSVKFFPEGGRSRTGRLLPPKTGMMAMTLQSFLRGVRRPMVLVPVYLGYDRIMEGNRYLGELSGQEKRSESMGQLLGVRKALKRSYGKAYVNFGEPIALKDYLDQCCPDWPTLRSDSSTPDRKNDDSNGKHFSHIVRDLSQQVMSNINDAVVVNCVNLVSTILLATERQAIDRSQLVNQIGIYLQLLKQQHYSAHIILPRAKPDTADAQKVAGEPGDTIEDISSAEQVVRETERLGMLRHVNHPMGEVVFVDDSEAVLMTWYRNNSLHVFAVPGLIASCFTQEYSLTTDEILERCRKLYPFLKNELFLHWNCDNFCQAVEQCLPQLTQLGLLAFQKRGAESQRYFRPSANEAAFVQLTLLAQTMQPLLERFDILVALLVQSDSLSRSQLERQGQLVAQRLSLLHKVNAPEFFDKRLFTTLLQTLRDQDMLTEAGDGGLTATASLKSLHAVTGNMVRFRIRQAIRQALRATDRTQPATQ